MTWNEPFRFSRRMRRHNGFSLPMWKYFAAGAGLTTFLGLCGLFGHFVHGDGGGQAMVWWSLGLGLALFLSTYVAGELIPSVVRVKDQGIERQCFILITIHVERWFWDNIAYARFERAKDYSKSFEILTLYSKDGLCVPLGRSRWLRVSKLQKLFEANEVPLKTDIPPETTDLSLLVERLLPPNAIDQMSIMGH